MEVPFIKIGSWCNILNQTGHSRIGITDYNDLGELRIIDGNEISNEVEGQSSEIWKKLLGGVLRSVPFHIIWSWANSWVEIADVGAQVELNRPMLGGKVSHVGLNQRKTGQSYRCWPKLTNVWAQLSDIANIKLG